jgi:hypothetical protein
LFKVLLPEVIFAAALMLSCLGLTLAWVIPKAAARDALAEAAGVAAHD